MWLKYLRGTVIKRYIKLARGSKSRQLWALPVNRLTMDYGMSRQIQKENKRQHNENRF